MQEPITAGIMPGMLNDTSILTLMPELISPYTKEQLQSHSYDCTLAETILVPSTNQNRSGKWIEHTLCKCSSDRCDYNLRKSEFVLGSTIEYFDLPDDVAGFVCGKSTIGRNGLQVENAGFIDAGFKGNITLELYNMAPWDIALRTPMPICQVIFFKVNKAEIKPYREVGHYQGQHGVTAPVYGI